MQKYGIEHFHIDLIEETDKPEERERFWIEEKGSFKNGYNATLGGDGRPYLDYEILIAAYLELKNINEVSRRYNCDASHLRRILNSRHIDVFSNQDVNKNYNGQCVNQYDLNNNYIQSFATAREAARAVRPNSTSIGGVTSHITDVCKGKRKTAYNYIWKYAKKYND